MTTAAELARSGVAGVRSRFLGPGLALLGVLVLLATTQPVKAHPHLFVDAQVALTFDAQGRLASIHDRWTFDDAYSEWAVQGLDANHDGKLTREELQSLANDNLKGLADYHFYTSAGEGTDNLNFPRASNGTLDYIDRRLVLNFDIAPAVPYAIRSSLELAVSDPEYYVAITLADAGAVKLINAPSVCAYVMEKGRPMPDSVARELYALPPDVTKLPPDLEVAMRGVQGGVGINCPGGTAGHGTSVEPTVESAAQSAEASSSAPAVASAPAAGGLLLWQVWALAGALAALALAIIGVVFWRLRR